MLTSQLPALSREEEFTIFLNGLRPDTRIEIQNKGIKTLNEAMVVASRYESLKHGSVIKHNNFNIKKGKPNLNKVTCHICKKIGHFASQCSKKGKQNSSPVKCHRCGLVGHMKAQCKVKLPNPKKIIKTNLASIKSGSEE